MHCGKCVCVCLSMYVCNFGFDFGSLCGEGRDFIVSSSGVCMCVRMCV